jgi:hypothetical protein
MAFKSNPTVIGSVSATAYTAGDVVGGAFRLVGLPKSPEVQDIYLTSCGLEIDVAAIPSGMTSFNLELYSENPPSATADNGVWSLAAADRVYHLGSISLGSPSLRGATTLKVEAEQVNKHIRPGSQGVWAYLVTNGAYTPAGNSEVYVPTVHAFAL